VLVDEDAARVEALFAVADTVKPGAAEAIAELHQLGVKTTMLTGDNEGAARNVARATGVDDFYANLLPAEKLAHVKRLAETGQTAMAGDGINDAPALAGAQIGFAMAAAGSDTAMETADIALMDDDLRKIPRFVRLSRRSVTILKENIALSIGIKLLFLALAAGGIATLWMAVFADVGTSLIVVANGLRAGVLAHGDGLRQAVRRA
jgi:Cd2+/Zn2+-exporting ATPase